MKGDKIITTLEQAGAARAICDLLKDQIEDGRLAVSVAGESGAGKSEVASELARLLGESGIRTMIFQQDDYFHYPPKTNEQMRRKNIKHVGLGEVNLRLLDEHIGQFKNAPDKPIRKPLVDFDEDLITTETVASPADFDFAVVEGTYTSLLNNVTYKIFIDRSFEDTRAHRETRGRDPLDEFMENVLEIEHKIIVRHKTMANILVNKDYSVTVVEH